MEAQTNASMVGMVIGGRYRLSKLLGEGGMGAVYAAEHINITKTVAVKLLHPEISSNPEAVARFKQEAQSASSIGHPNIIGIDDFFTMEDGRVCLIMEFLKGESLADRMQLPGGLALESAVDLMLQVCAGLAAAHEKGIIHRDMKPENVFIAMPQGREIVKILDFGIAKVTGNQDNSLTKTGTVFGTPHYMSPEQALGHKVDARADIYSVGVMLFEIFTGQVPFQSESFMGVLSQHITKPTPAPSSMTPGRPVPPMMEDIILTAMAKEVDKRFSTMNALAGALSAFSQALHSSQPPKAVTGRVAAADVAARAGLAAPPAVAPTMAAAPGAPAPTQGPGPVARLSTDEPSIPKTMMATGPQMAAQGGVQPQAQPSFTPSVPVVPTPASQLNMGPVPVVPSPTGQTAPKKQKKSKTGLIIGLVVALLLVGGGAVAAVVFWDDIMGGKDPGKGTAVAGTAAGTAEGTGSGSGQPIATNTGADAATKAAVTPDAGSGATQDPGTGSGTGSTVAQKDPDPKDPDPGKKDPVVKKDPVKPIKKDPIVKKDPVKKDPVKPIKKDPVKPIKKDPVVKKDPVKPPQGCTVRLASRPTRARLISGGTGFTPKTFKLDAGETLTVRLAKGGWREKSVTLSCARKKVTVQLRKGFNLDVGGGNPGIPGGGL